MERANISSNSSRSTRTFALENLGCAKNQVDAEVIIAALQNEGWLFVSDPGEADLIIVNSCGFIQSAKEESIQVSLDLKKAHPDRKLLLAGCFAQRYGGELSESLPELDGIFGNRALSLIGRAAGEVMAGNRPVLIPSGEEETGADGKAPDGKASGMPVPGEADGEGETVRRDRLLSFPGSVYIKISEGCDNNCSYCAIPLIRGGLKSRTIESITREIRDFITRGTREFNFVGQDLSGFGKDRGAREFPKLLEAVSALEGDFWIRLLYIHPDHFPREILEICRRDPRILPYFDIPFQHASERILRKMGRKGNAALHLDLIREIRETLPEAVIRSTLMVGFPGESGADFRELEAFQQKARLDWLGVFSYSREEGTPAAELAGPAFRLGARTREKRKAVLMAAQLPISEERMEAYVGRELKVLVEEPVEGEELYLGRAACQAPDVDGAVVIRAIGLVPGTFVQTRIIRRNGIDLEAVPL